MSSATDFSAFFTDQAVAYCGVSSAVILFWDYIITFGDEINLVWRRKLTGATILFLLNRYASLIKNVVEFSNLFSPSLTACQRSQTAYNIFDLSALFVFAGATRFSAFRVWAIWGRELRPFLFILPFCLVTPVLNAYRVAKATPIFDDEYPSPWGGCEEDIGMPITLYIQFGDITRAIAIVTDGLVLIMTWIKTYSIYRAARRAGAGTGLSQLLIRDGTLYFGTLLVFNILAVVINSTSADLNPVNYFNDNVNCIFISRFILNLRSVGANINNRAGTSTSGKDTVMWGGLGGPLAHNRSSVFSGYTQDITMQEFERMNGPLAAGLKGWKNTEDVPLKDDIPEADLHYVESFPAPEDHAIELREWHHHTENAYARPSTSSAQSATAYSRA
ncbi:uncharacterized protein PHACADRAFT_26171 [Phanerochaete carnosa HHB-10118-sp]|uniref:DUF6533 domain-containing protein n=1 Tax=Phanerochaete carnosa (strain HHB-10118-sp) TaxID=650164 RepID=K5WDY8_PHACS|nr:uncharacterized protein PHACADRAFT_26171 [Phanerochaete carnosa HHB-10118-sp]EKM57500.1 hypothetical protein PHACADRAFT_26171 [Phanerochaete carnosa HHB-10118-sp]